MKTNSFLKSASLFSVGLAAIFWANVRPFAADKLNLIYTARVMPESRGSIAAISTGPP